MLVKYGEIKISPGNAPASALARTALDAPPDMGAEAKAAALAALPGRAAADNLSRIGLYVGGNNTLGALPAACRRSPTTSSRRSSKSRRSGTPRPDIVWLDPADEPARIVAEIRESGHSRLVVSRGDIDEVLGIVHAKDLLDRALQGLPFDLQATMRKPLIVHDGTPVLRLLEMFRETSLHIAVVVDEYGSVEGLVTVTDILSAIAGEFPDAGDTDKSIVRRDDGSWLIDGMTPIDEVEALIRQKDMRGEADFHTLAGFVLTELGHLPKAAEHFIWRRHRFEVVDMDGRRIDKVMVVPPATDPDDEDGDGI